jgi:P27 family predicted phage terminase small subunit
MKPPAYLDKVARDHWKLVIQLMEDSGNLLPIDQDAIALYCVAFATWREAEAHLKAQDRVIYINENPKRNPWQDISNKAVDTLKPLQDRLGMSPQARAKLKPTEGHESDPLQDFLACGQP